MAGATDLDPLFYDVAFLLHFDGADTSTDIIDETGKSWTAINSAQVSTTQSKFGGSSLSLDGTGDYITQGAIGDYNWLHNGTTDWTLEMWVYRSAASFDTFLDTGGGPTSNHGVYGRIESDGAIRFLMSRGVSSQAVIDYTSASAQVGTGAWVHLALDYDADVGLEVYVDGVSIGSIANSYTQGTGNHPVPMRIGYYSVTGGYDFGGYIDDIRLTKARRYTAGFTAPTAAFPSSRFAPGLEPTVVDPFYNHVFSVLHGDGDYTDEMGHSWTAEASTSTDLAEGINGAIDCTDGNAGLTLTGADAIGLGDFTIEWRMKAASHPGYNCHIFDCNYGSVNGFSVIALTADSGALAVWINNADQGSGTTNVYDGKWHDICVMRRAGTFYVLVDGESEISFASTHNFTSTTHWFGRYFSALTYSAGCYLDEYRLTIGRARYPIPYRPTGLAVPDHAFDPAENVPRTLWTPASTDAQLWLDASDATTIDAPAGIGQWDDKSGNARHATGSGNVAVVRQLNGLDTIDFDGTGDYFTTPAFTQTTQAVFMVFMADTLAGDRSPLNHQWGDTVAPYQLYVAATGEVKDWRVDSTTGAGSIAAGTPVLLSHAIEGQAIGDVRSWADGTLGTASTAAVASYPNSRALSIGRAQTQGSLGGLDGYVAEVVIVSGIMSDGDRQRMEGYLAWKWGRETALPEYHPYRFSAPAADTSTLWTPAQLTTDLWLDAADDTTISHTAGAVDQWDDKSGNLRHAGQVTGANQPTYDANNNWIDFDGSTSKMSLASQPFSGSTARLVISVIRTDVLGSTGNGFFSASDVSGGSGSYWDLCPETSDFYVRVSGNDAFRPAFGTDTIEVISADWISGNSDTTKVFNNGAQLSRNSGSSVASISTSVGTAWLGQTPQQGGIYYNGKIMEMVVLTGAEITDDNRQLLEGYLAWKWGKELSLPPGHPYRYFAPTVPATAPTIDTQPAAQSVTEPAVATFTVAATTSGGTLTYQWYETTAGLLSGETASTLALATTFAMNGNSYYVIVSDDNGSTQSDTATLTVAASGGGPGEPVGEWPKLNDLTDPREPSTPGSVPLPSYKREDWVGLQKAAEGPGIKYYDEYRFSGRTFRKRDQFTNERSEDE